MSIVSGTIPAPANLGVDGAPVKEGYLCEETTLFGEVGGSNSRIAGEADLEGIWNQGM